MGQAQQLRLQQPWAYRYAARAPNPLCTAREHQHFQLWTSQAVVVLALHVLMLSEATTSCRQARPTMCESCAQYESMLVLSAVCVLHQESSVLHFQPLSAPLLPAHAVIVDESRKQLLLLVRGTSSWADCLTDIVAHTEPLGSGRWGLLGCWCGCGLDDQHWMIFLHRAREPEGNQ